MNYQRFKKFSMRQTRRFREADEDLYDRLLVKYGSIYCDQVRDSELYFPMSELNDYFLEIGYGPEDACGLILDGCDWATCNSKDSKFSMNRDYFGFSWTLGDPYGTRIISLDRKDLADFLRLEIDKDDFLRWCETKELIH